MIIKYFIKNNSQFITEDQFNLVFKLLK